MATRAIAALNNASSQLLQDIASRRGFADGSPLCEVPSAAMVKVVAPVSLAVALVAAAVLWAQDPAATDAAASGVRARPYRLCSATTRRLPRRGCAVRTTATG